MILILSYFKIFIYLFEENFLKNLDKTNSIPKMRFTETEGASQEDPNSNDNPDGLDININFNDENKNFLFVRSLINDNKIK